MASRIDWADAEQDGPEGARILLVDDDTAALSVACTILRRAGFDVATEPSGHEALARLAGADSFSALVTDFAMPGLSGAALLQLAREQRPGLPALVITGYGRQGDLQRLPAGVPVLSKPFTRADFVKQVTDLIRAA